MNLKKLLDKGMIEKIGKNENLIKNTFELAKRDLKVAKDNLKNKNYDWTFSIAYNSMLQSARALMFYEGYRAKGEYKHLSVVEFLKIKFVELSDQIFIFNKMRKKRHLLVYEEIDLISSDEALRSVDVAKKFVEKIRGCIKVE